MSALRSLTDMASTSLEAAAAGAGGEAERCALEGLASSRRASASRVRLRRSGFSKQSALLKPALLIKLFISETDSASTPAVRACLA